MLAGYARRITVPRLAGRALAVASIGTPIGLAVGTPFGSWLGTTFDWRWSFGALSVLVGPDPCPGRRPRSRCTRPARRVPLAHHRRVRHPRRRPDPRRHPHPDGRAQHRLHLHRVLPALRRRAAVSRRALVTYGVAALAGIAITAALVDRILRPLVLLSIALFITAGVIFVVGQQSLAAILTAIVLWGLAYGGAATQLQTAISEASGENADVANSMLGVSFNLAIFAAGVLGAVLISTYDGLALPIVMIGPALVALANTHHSL